ncbi:hypothetical protein VTH06DRAFT_5754 [Thermothelomyces fergusii]
MLIRQYILGSTASDFPVCGTKYDAKPRRVKHSPELLRYQVPGTDGQLSQKTSRLRAQKQPLALGFPRLAAASARVI